VQLDDDFGVATKKSYNAWVGKPNTEFSVQVLALTVSLFHIPSLARNAIKQCAAK